MYNIVLFRTICKYNFSNYIRTGRITQMKRKVLSAILAVSMVATMVVGCGSSSSSTTTDTAAETEEATEETTDDAAATETADASVDATGMTVGLAMPTQSSERWINDAANMKAQLEAIGYTVEVQFAEDDVQAQVSQIENLIAKQVDCLVIAAVDSGALTTVEAQAKDAGIPIIAYDRLLMDTDAVSYYATFDNKGVGTAIANYIVEAKDLENAEADGKSYNIEFFMGSPDDNNALFLYNGVMEVLQPYLDNGVLVCKSGRTSFEDTCILRWSQETAQQNCENILTGFYADEKVDILCTAFDGFAYGCKAALEGAGYKVGEDWPLITGQDAELMAVKNIISGSQTMSIYKDTRLLAEKCVSMVNAVLQGTEPEINDTEQYDNGVIVVPSYLCTPVAVDQSNYEEIIVDGGYYTEEQLAQ
jgi:putative multiple sugar transport system substrate-binding protein